MSNPRIFACEIIENNKLAPHEEIKLPFNLTYPFVDLPINPNANFNMVNNDPNPDSAPGTVRVQIGTKGGHPIVVCVRSEKVVSLKVQYALRHIFEIEEEGFWLGGNRRVEKPGKKDETALVVVFVPKSAVKNREEQLLNYEKGRQVGYEQGRQVGYEQGLREATLKHQQQMQQIYLNQMKNMQQVQESFSVAFTDGPKPGQSSSAPAPKGEIHFGQLGPVPVVDSLGEAPKPAKDEPKPAEDKKKDEKEDEKKDEKKDKEEKVVKYEMVASDKCENGGHLGEVCDCAPCQERMTREFLAREKDAEEAASTKDSREFPMLGTTPPKKEAWELELEQEQHLATAMANEKKAEEKLHEEARLAKAKAERDAAKLPKPKYTTLKTFMSDKAVQQQKQRELKYLAIQISKREGLEYAQEHQDRIKMYGIEVPHIELYSQKITAAKAEEFLTKRGTPLECNINAGLKAYHGLLDAFKEAHPFLSNEDIQIAHENFGKLVKIIDDVHTMYRVTWAKALYSVVKPTLLDMDYKKWNFINDDE